MSSTAPRGLHHDVRCGSAGQTITQCDQVTCAVRLRGYRMRRKEIYSYGISLFPACRTSPSTNLSRALRKTQGLQLISTPEGGHSISAMSSPSPPAIPPAGAPVSLAHLDACTSLYDLTTEQLQQKLSDVVSSVSHQSADGAPLSLDTFLLLEKQILLIHSELRERHLTAALHLDPWMDSELDDVHVGQRQRQEDDVRRETDAVDRQLRDLQSQSAIPSSQTIEQQHWANRNADRRGLDEARKRRGESGAVRVVPTATAGPSKKKPSSGASKPKPKSTSGGHSGGLSIPENILNQRREMVIMTSSVDNRRMNKSSHGQKKVSAKSSPGSSQSSPPLSPASSPPGSKRSMSKDSSQASLGRSDSTRSLLKGKKDTKELSAHQKAKLYAEAQKAESKSKQLKSKHESSSASRASTAFSSPRASTTPDRSDSAASSSHAPQHTRPGSTASTEIDDGSSAVSPTLSVGFDRAPVSGCTTTAAAT